MWESVKYNLMRVAESLELGRECWKDRTHLEEDLFALGTA